MPLTAAGQLLVDDIDEDVDLVPSCSIAFCRSEASGFYLPAA